MTQQTDIELVRERLLNISIRSRRKERNDGMRKETETTMVTSTIEAGALVRPYLRDVLDQMTFEVPKSRYKKSKGFLSSVFL